jgi:tRNA(Ile2)-agmatinylcytidine synthase
LGERIWKKETVFIVEFKECCMTIIGLDDTDSRELGMCTTYVAHLIASDLESQGYETQRVVLARLNPAAKHKTRGNACLSIHTEAPIDRGFETAREHIVENSKVDDPETNPGLVVFDNSNFQTTPIEFESHARNALHELLSVENAKDVLSKNQENVIFEGWGNNRGLIGATAAIGIWDAMDDFTYEYISYREPEKWGEKREFNPDTAKELAKEYYPSVWDTVDFEQDYVVAVPNTPCPILYGIRGDDKSAVTNVATNIESETVYTSRLFHTNQGTDMHLEKSNIEDATENSSHEIPATVVTEPETEEGGHVFFEIGDADGTLSCAAFSPTHQFKDHVRNLRQGDEIIACGGVSDGTLKLEKFAVTNLNETKLVNPSCNKCNITMESAGANQGYRCRKCSETADEKEEINVERDIEIGWYEVPPSARRHIAKPLIRSEKELPTHSER